MTKTQNGEFVLVIWKLELWIYLGFGAWNLRFTKDRALTGNGEIRPSEKEIR